MNPTGKRTESVFGLSAPELGAFSSPAAEPAASRQGAELPAHQARGSAPEQPLAAERGRLLADRLGVGFWQRDVGADTLDWDAQMFRIHGRDPALGAPHFSEWIDVCVHPLDRAWVADRMRQIEAAWSPVTDLCFRAQQPDEQGAERWVQIWGRRMEVGGQRVCFGMHLEVTDHQRQQTLLANERERTRYAIAAAEVGVWECDPDGRLCHANEVMYRQLGLETDARVLADPAVLSKRVRNLAHPDDWRRLQDRLRRRLASGEPFRHELPLRHSGARPRWLALQGRALRGPDGRVCGMAGVQIDITERKQTEALQLDRQRLEQASRDKSVFMARMSHELRTPMNAVLGFTRLLEDDTLDPPSPRQRERLARIAQAGDRLLALIDNLLELARLDSEREPEPARPLPLSELLREAAAAVAGDAERAGVRLLLPRGVVGKAMGDRRRLVQALGHVLLQVIQRSAPGAELVLQVEMPVRTHAASDAALARTGGVASFTAGLDEGESPLPSHVALVRILDPARLVPGQSSLFDQASHVAPVAQGDAAPAQASTGAADATFDHGQDTVFDHGLDTEPDALGDTPGPGVDLGLSLALRLVRAVGGHIRTREADAAHRLAVPAARLVHELQLPGLPSPLTAAAGRDEAARPSSGAPSGDEVGRAAPPPTRPAFHVLCVEDNPVNLQLVREVFALRPRVLLTTAVDGGSGLAQALADPPDLVLLDLQLPDMNGLEVLHRLRTFPALAACTVIALSADAMPEHIAAGRAAGFDDYWTKPIQFDRFLADIDRLAEARALRGT
jgi:PAS domain S-box-containing protein